VVEGAGVLELPVGELPPPQATIVPAHKNTMNLQKRLEYNIFFSHTTQEIYPCKSLNKTNY
jgi:hypothetical protein